MKQNLDLPPIWGLAMIALAGLLAWLLPLWRFDPPVWLAVALVVGGFGLMLWTLAWFKMKATPMMPRQVPTALIVEGPFRINRNPIYSGMVLVILGAAFWFGALSALLPVIAFPLIITSRFIKEEEDGLRAVFGAQADEYFSKTRRW